MEILTKVKFKEAFMGKITKGMWNYILFNGIIVLSKN